MKNVLATLFILIGLGLSIYGFSRYSKTSIEAVEVSAEEVSTADSGIRQQAYLLMGLGLLSLTGGLYLIKRKF